MLLWIFYGPFQAWRKNIGRATYLNNANAVPNDVPQGESSSERIYRYAAHRDIYTDCPVAKDTFLNATNSSGGRDLMKHFSGSVMGVFYFLKKKLEFRSWAAPCISKYICAVRRELK